MIVLVKKIPFSTIIKTNNQMGYLYILLTIIFTVYGQLILKYRIAMHGIMPENIFPKLLFLLKLFLDPLIFSGFFSAFLASLCWMAAMTKFELSHAYPFMSLAYVLVFLFSIIFMNETFTMNKIVGLVLIILGIIISSK
jgi:multidrug transporter EmrE-like cation transporter